MTWRILHGNSIELLPTLDPESYGSCVTDPPYGYSFMGAKWDSPDNVAFRPELWRAVYRVMRPGAYLVAFGGTRKFHRLMVAIEDAGFVLRDTLCWLYGQGMPKSHDVSKAIDKAAGAERKVVGPTTRGAQSESTGRYGAWGEGITPTAPATEAAKQWDGYGTALSPSWEPIVLAQKPISGTIAGNVLEHGVGALNVDGCRLPHNEPIEATVRTADATKASYAQDAWTKNMKRGAGIASPSTAGRWPPNVALDEEAARLVDEQSGERPAGHVPAKTTPGLFFSGSKTYEARSMGDTGGASRFMYCPKASTAERNAGLGDEQNTWPTVKPIALMRWLCRLVTPPGETVLDPFCGSGSTGCAAVLEGLPFVGLEQDAEAVRIARLRIHYREPNDDEAATVAPPRAKQGRLF